MFFDSTEAHDTVFLDEQWYAAKTGIRAQLQVPALSQAVVLKDEMLLKMDVSLAHTVNEDGILRLKKNELRRYLVDDRIEGVFIYRASSFFSFGPVMQAPMQSLTASGFSVQDFRLGFIWLFLWDFPVCRLEASWLSGDYLFSSGSYDRYGIGTTFTHLIYNYHDSVLRFTAVPNELLKLTGVLTHKTDGPQVSEWVKVRQLYVYIGPEKRFSCNLNFTQQYHEGTGGEYMQKSWMSEFRFVRPLWIGFGKTTFEEINQNELRHYYLKFIFTERLQVKIAHEISFNTEYGYSDEENAYITIYSEF